MALQRHNSSDSAASLATTVFSKLLNDADLERELKHPAFTPSPINSVEVRREFVECRSTGHQVFCLRTGPSWRTETDGEKTEQKQQRTRNVLLLHDQTTTSTVWEEIGTLQFLATFGFRCVAPDLPGYGLTKGPLLESARARLHFLDAFLSELNWSTDVILVGTSMAGQYIIPALLNSIPSGHTVILPPNAQRNEPINEAEGELMISTKMLKCKISALVAIALSDTNQLATETLAQKISMPCLVLRGELDTSLGLNAAQNLGALPCARVVVVPEGRHLCHRSHTRLFHTLVLNFLELCGANGLVGGPVYGENGKERKPQQLLETEL